MHTISLRQVSFFIIISLFQADSLRAAGLPETLIVIILGVIVVGNCLHFRLMMLCMGTRMLLSGLIQDTEPQLLAGISVPETVTLNSE